jgi:hypothetical protein
MLVRVVCVPICTRQWTARGLARAARRFKGSHCCRPRSTADRQGQDRDRSRELHNPNCCEQIILLLSSSKNTNDLLFQRGTKVCTDNIVVLLVNIKVYSIIIIFLFERLCRLNRITDALSNSPTLSFLELQLQDPGATTSRVLFSARHRRRKVGNSSTYTCTRVLGTTVLLRKDLNHGRVTTRTSHVHFSTGIWREKTSCFVVCFLFFFFFVLSDTPTPGAWSVAVGVVSVAAAAVVVVVAAAAIAAAATAAPPQ